MQMYLVWITMVVDKFLSPLTKQFFWWCQTIEMERQIYGNIPTFSWNKWFCQKIKYAYGYKFNGERMKRQKIMLPVTKKWIARLWLYDFLYSKNKIGTNF